MKWILVVLALAPVGLFAYQATPLRNTTIAGQVIDGDRGAPIADAMVRAVWPPGGGSDGAILPSTRTDDAGRFVLSGLSPGQFTVVAEKRGYGNAAYGKGTPNGVPQYLDVVRGGRIDDVRIQMWSSGAISGTVIDEANRPLAGIDVHAWRRSAPERETWQASTDANGVFRLEGVPSGEYLVAAIVGHVTRRAESDEARGCRTAARQPVAKPDAAASSKTAPPERGLCVDLSPSIMPPEPDAEGQRRTYESVLFPAVSDAAVALPVQVEAGVERAGVLMQLRAVRGVRIRGTIQWPRGTLYPHRLPIRLYRSSNQPSKLPDATAVWEGEPGFTFLDVPPGRYRLVAHSQSQFGEGPPNSNVVATTLAIDVGEDAIDDLVVSFAEPVSVHGRMVFNGATPPPAFLAVAFWSTEPGVTARGQILSRGGEFHVSGLVPSTYSMFVGARGPFWVEAIVAGGRDATASAITIGPGGLGDVVITLTDRPASVAGTVVRADGGPVADAVAVVFPSQAATWPGANASMFRFARVLVRGGRYAFPSLVPGDYFVAALDEREIEDWPSAALLKTIAAGAVRLRVTPGSQQTLTLPLLRVKPR
jgi:hypothetical protein